MIIRVVFKILTNVFFPHPHHSPKQNQTDQNKTAFYRARKGEVYLKRLVEQWDIFRLF